MTKQKYIVQYGNRRLIACKKLGWERIEAKIQGEELTKNINIDEIEIKENMRHAEDIKISQLMQSIKLNGLLEPISLISSDKEITKDFFLINVVENLHREDVSPVEVGKIIDNLHTNHQMSVSEIAVRIGIATATAERFLKIFKLLPEEYWDYVGLKKRPTEKGSGKISPSVIEDIVTMRIKKAEIVKLLNFVKENEISKDKFAVMKRYVQNGGTVEEAMNKIDEMEQFNVSTTVYKSELQKLFREQNVKTKAQLFEKILSGDCVPPKRFLMLPRH